MILFVIIGLIPVVFGVGVGVEGVRTAKTTKNKEVIKVEVKKAKEKADRMSETWCIGHWSRNITFQGKTGEDFNKLPI